MILFCGSLLSLGCQRESKKTSSSIIIQVPKAANALNKSGGVGALATMPADRKACYGIVLSGQGLANQTPTCAPPGATRAGFVEPGGVVEVTAPKGSGRTVELFAYLQNPGENNPCPGFSVNPSPTQVVATYKIGSVINVDMMADETHITIDASFPGLSNNYAMENSLPAFCSSGAAGPGGPALGQISSAQMAVSGSGVKLVGRVGGAWSNQVLTGSGVTLKVKQ